MARGGDTSSDGHRSGMRARLIEGGGDAFHDYELLENVLALITPRRDTKPLAKQLIAEFGTMSASPPRPKNSGASMVSATPACPP